MFELGRSFYGVCFARPIAQARYIGDLGEPNREIDFDFDSFARAGEAKLRGRVKGPFCRWGLQRKKILLVLLLLLLARGWQVFCVAQFVLLYVLG